MSVRPDLVGNQVTAAAAALKVRRTGLVRPSTAHSPESAQLQPRRETLTCRPLEYPRMRKVIAIEWRLVQTAPTPLLAPARDRQRFYFDFSASPGMLNTK